MIRRSCLAVMCVIGMASPCLAQTSFFNWWPFGSLAPGVAAAFGARAVKDVIGDIQNKVQSDIFTASNQAAFAEEHAANQANLVLLSANYILAGEMDKRIDQLSWNKQNFLMKLDQSVNDIQNSKDDILRLEDFAALDAQNLIQQLPFVSDKFLIRRIDGYSQIFRGTGSYPFLVIGNAFGPDTRCEISVNGKSVPVDRVSYPQANSVMFDVPVDFLNASFTDDNVVRAPISIKAYSRSKNKLLYAYSDKILLLPKLPLSYQLEETYMEPGFSTDTQSIANTTVLPPTGKENRHVQFIADVQVPSGTQMLPETCAVSANPFPNGSWTTFQGAPQKVDERTMRQNIDYWVHDKPNYVTISVRYRTPTSFKKNRDLVLSDGSHAAAPKRIAFGTYTADLGSGYQLFELSGQFFNGEKIVLTPSSAVSPRARATVDSGGQVARLVLQVGQKS